MAIFCSQCGAENHQDALSCYHCQSPIARLNYGADPHGNAPQYTAEGYQEAGTSEADNSRKASGLSRMGSLFVGVVCVIYLLNPTAGVDLIPDFIPIVGNLDEAGAVAALLMALSNLGIIPYRRQ